jgi:Protein of unknown function (DUF3667)
MNEAATGEVVAAAPARVLAAAVTPAQVPAAHCDNCGATLSGRYCATCGQRREAPVNSLWHFTQLATEDLTHADSRLWRTLAALLYKPGHLTREFLTGHRARYLPPVRLYLVMSVVFFLWAASTQSSFDVVQLDQDQLNAAHVKVETLDQDDAAAVFAPKPGETEEQRTQRLCGTQTYNGPWSRQIAPIVPQLCRKIATDISVNKGRLLREAFLHNLPRAMFIFLPLLAGIMMLMYWRPRHFYVEHLLLFVHNHAFVFLVAILSWGLAKVLPQVLESWLTFAVLAYLAWYMFRSLRVVYGQGRWLTFAKLALLSFFYLVFGVLMLTITSLYSVFSL